MADRKFRLGQVLDPFDFDKYPSMSSQMIESMPSVFGDDDPNLLQTANRVMLGGPLDLFDLAGRAGDVGMRGVSEGVEYVTGLPGLKRDIYGMLTAGGLMAGSNPSSMSRTTRASQGKSAPQQSTPYFIGDNEGGIMQAVPAKKPKVKKQEDVIVGEIVTGPNDEFLRLKSEQEKSMTQARKTQLQEDMDVVAITDAFEDIEDLFDRPDVVLDSVINEVYMPMADGKSMGDAIMDILPGILERNNEFVASKDVLKGLSKRLDEYGYGFSKDVKRRQEGAESRRQMENRAARARDAQKQREKEYAMGIRPDMTPEEKTAIIMRERERIYREATEAQNTASGMGIPDETSLPPRLVVIEGGKDN